MAWLEFSQRILDDHERRDHEADGFHGWHLSRDASRGWFNPEPELCEHVVELSAIEAGDRVNLTMTP